MSQGRFHPYQNPSTSKRLLYLLFAGDLVFILLHLLHKFTPHLPDSLYSITRDGGYAEFYQHTKELWIILLLFFIAIRIRKLLYAAYTGLFSFFLFDDFFQIHEKVGETLANFLQLPPAFGLRPQDFGELAAYGFFGLIFVLLIGLAHYRSDPETQRVSRRIVVLVALLAVFGIVFDMLEISVNHPVLGPIMGIFDDGGEMLVMSGITGFVFKLSVAPVGANGEMQPS